MARKETQMDRERAKIKSSTGYHRSRFQSLKYFTSDRFEELTEYFQRKNGQPLKGYGLEMELSSSLPSQNALCTLLQMIYERDFHADLFRMENDCSLRGSSTVECVSQIMTKEAIRNFYPAFRRLYNEYFPAFQIEANDSCGMHCNISNGLLGQTEEKQAEAAKKLLYIINKHYTFMCAMLRRNPSATGYCARMNEYTSKEECKAADLEYMSGSHGNCCNWSHFTEGRIELRLVGPQRNYAAFRNTMETVFHLVDTVKRISWTDCDSLVKIFSGCNQHVYDRLTLAKRETGKLTETELAEINEKVKTENFQ